jgi:hypothetical protein
MSHPLGYEEGSGKFQSTIPRCKHFVYSPTGDGKPSSACDGCQMEIAKENQKQCKEK